MLCYNLILLLLTPSVLFAMVEERNKKFLFWKENEPLGKGIFQWINLKGKFLKTIVED